MKPKVEAGGYPPTRPGEPDDSGFASPLDRPCSWKQYDGLNQDLSLLWQQGDARGLLSRLHQDDCRVLLQSRLRFYLYGPCRAYLLDAYTDTLVRTAKTLLSGKEISGPPLRFVLWQAKCTALDR
jgi:hypothetical protein